MTHVGQEFTLCLTCFKGFLLGFVQLLQLHAGYEKITEKYPYQTN